MKIAKIKQRNHLERDLQITNRFKRLNSRFDKHIKTDPIVKSTSLLEVFKTTPPRAE